MKTFLCLAVVIFLVFLGISLPVWPQLTPAALLLPANTIATLGTTCTAGQKGLEYFVTDAAATPVYNATVTGSGAVIIPVFCNGTNWVNH